MRHIYTNGTSISTYDDIANQNADHSSETFYHSYTEEEYNALERPIRVINGNIFFGWTEEEKAQQKEAEKQRAKEQEINNLKAFLSDTDDIALRLATGEAKETDISSRYNMTYAEIMAKRAETRKQIEALKNETSSI